MKFTFLFISCLFITGILPAQSWNFIKEKDGIKVFTRNEPGSSLKSYKGEVIFEAPMEKVCSVLDNVKDISWWDKDISDVKVLAYEKNKYAQYYLIYHMPWPMSNRDLVVETRISTDPVTGARSFMTKPLLNTVPEKSGLVRIRNYQQTWIVRSLDNGNVQVILEGSTDPGGDIPSWVTNMVVAETPLMAIASLRDKILSGK